jgi:hypothetical protein
MKGYTKGGLELGIVRVDGSGVFFCLQAHAKRNGISTVSDYFLFFIMYTYKEFFVFVLSNVENPVYLKNSLSSHAS